MFKHDTLKTGEKELAKQFNYPEKNPTSSIHQSQKDKISKKVKIGK